MRKKKRLPDEQIIGFLPQAQAEVPVNELCRQRGFSDAAFYGWRATFDGMQVDDAERLKTLEGESVKLEKPPAEALLDAEELKAALLGKP